MEIMNYHKTFLDLSFAEVPTMRRSQSLPPATFWAASRADFSKTAYAESLMCRAAEAFSWPVHVNENLGSLGHPEICGSPCIRFYYGSCKKGMDCQFCHLEHEASKKKLDKMQRHCFESMTEAQVLAVLLFHMERRCQKKDITDQMILILSCVRRRLKLLPEPQLTPEMTATLSKAFNKLTVGRLLDLVKQSRSVSHPFKAELQSIVARTACCAR
ncbi:unnamed protein product [Durusdinium trenchii]|uniref:C3H1-type domain-containing protein n=2 Tax=Durusdinium trenchii TaxID=1381693 RepID=A0ABP0MFP1_9DINO